MKNYVKSLISSNKFCSPGRRKGFYSRANKICSLKPPPIRFREIKNCKQIAKSCHICLHFESTQWSMKIIFATILNSFCSHNNGSLVHFERPIKLRSALMEADTRVKSLLSFLVGDKADFLADSRVSSTQLTVRLWHN